MLRNSVKTKHSYIKDTTTCVKETFVNYLWKIKYLCYKKLNLTFDFRRG